MNNIENIKSIGRLEFDFFRQTVAYGGRRAELTDKEFKLFWVLCSNAGQTFSRTELLEICWPDNKVTNRNPDTQISRLRPKLRCLFATDGEVIEKRYQEGYTVTAKLIEA